MVYKDVQLVWTAKTQSAPIFVDIVKLGDQAGLMITLADNGWLQVVYLGTDTPTSQVAQPAAQEKQDYDQMSSEHQRLLARIRNHEDEKQTEPPESLVVSTNLASFIEGSGEYVEDPTNKLARNEAGKLLRMKFKITLSFRGSHGSEGNILKNI
jgi:hypothetical protein